MELHLLPVNNKEKTGDFVIRHAGADDVTALAALHVAAFNETHGLGPGYAIREYQWQQAFGEENKNWFCLLIEKKDGSLAGFAKGMPYDHEDLPGYSGELNKIYLLKAYQKIGLGRKLLEKVAQEFILRGIDNMLLFGDADNPSNGFYEAMGAEKLFAKNGDFHGGYGWKDLRIIL